MSSSFHTDLQVKHAATSPRCAFFLLLLIDEVACHVTSSSALVVFMSVLGESWEQAYSPIAPCLSSSLSSSPVSRVSATFD